MKRSFLATLLLSYFLGCFGAHRFYTGHIGTAIAQLFTFGGCGIWALVDLIFICLNKFNDAQGQELEDYNPIAVYIILVIWGIMFFMNFVNVFTSIYANGGV